MHRKLVVALMVLTGCDTGELVWSAGEPETNAQAVPDPVPAAGVQFRCTPIKVYDGDGPLWCAEGQRIRLSGIAAREMDGTCRDYHPCPDATAEAARDRLVSLVSVEGTRSAPTRSGHVEVSGPPLTCTSTGSAGRKRVGAWCVSPMTGDLSCAMLASGTVAKWAQYWRDHRCQ